MVYSNTRFRSNTDIFNNIGETSIFLLYSCFCQFYTHIWKWDFFSSKFIKITFFSKYFEIQNYENVFFEYDVIDRFFYNVQYKECL